MACDNLKHQPKSEIWAVHYAVGRLSREINVMRCQLCLKSGMSGNNVSHSNRHTKTRFKANVHKQTLDRDGTPVTVKICSRCLRSLHKSPKVRKAFAALK